ncbi:type II secretion system F family protein [Streptomyces inhibens]|uniref:type II secretion system F family protein n=1 Tax=Streptomyces inhibens TaxID=2293571 RepID=UPI001EE72CC7|nr:type II secretion system F family protein [Streptomyces inhibens]UKY51739.1 type II secretion system F family protein [Streptomyces inhibens]
MTAEVVHRVGMAIAAGMAVRCAVALVREARDGRTVRRRVSALWGGGLGRYGGPDRYGGGDGARPRSCHRTGDRFRWRGRGTAARGEARTEGEHKREGRRDSGPKGEGRRDSGPKGEGRRDSGPTGEGRWDGGPKAWLGSLGAAAFVAILVGGVAGAMTGLAVGFGAHRWLARQRGADAARLAVAEVRAELAPAGDLLAACLAAGAGPRESAEAVGRSLDGPVAERLRQVAAELRLGGEPALVWPRLAALPGAEGLARCMERAGISGVPAVESVSRIAAELRAEQARAAITRARRAGVLVTLPLAACFLPAFLTLGVAPVLIGLAGELLGGN